MIEKLLRRFVNEATEFVLKAMEKVGADPELDTIGKFPLRQKYGEMIDAAFNGATRFADRYVLKSVGGRLERERQREAKRRQARGIAAQIMLGEDFNAKQSEVTKFQMAQQMANQRSILQSSIMNAAGQQGVLGGMSPYGGGFQ